MLRESRKFRGEQQGSLRIPSKETMGFQKGATGTFVGSQKAERETGIFGNSIREQKGSLRVPTGKT